MHTFNVGVRFQPIGEEDKSTEKFIANKHWALVFTPVEQSVWSLRVELREQNNVLSFPINVVDSQLFAHPLGTWTGSLHDITDLMQAHPMRDTRYSAAYNNCQQWAATLLLMMQAFASSTIGRDFTITHDERYTKVLSVLCTSGRAKLFHKPNLLLELAHLAGVGGGAAAMGAAAIAAEATTTVLVPATGIAGWFGATTAATIPIASAGAAAAMVPLLAVASGGIAATYIYQTLSWKKKTTFDDPRKGGCPTNTRPLSSTENGELSALGGSSLASSSASSVPTGFCLLGMYSGVNIGAVSAACAPASAVSAAPVAAALTVGAIAAGIRMGS